MDSARGRTLLYRESADSPYELVLRHDNSIDLEKIHAEFKDGVLASACQDEAIKPRNIASLRPGRCSWM